MSDQKQLTDRELLELLVTKTITIEQDLAHLKQGQSRLESKVDANHIEVIDKLIALKLVTIHIDTDLGKLITEFKGYRRFSQGAITDIQIRQEHLEDELERVKSMMTKAS